MACDSFYPICLLRLMNALAGEQGQQDENGRRHPPGLGKGHWCTAVSPVAHTCVCVTLPNASKSETHD